MTVRRIKNNEERRIILYSQLLIMKKTNFTKFEWKQNVPFDYLRLGHLSRIDIQNVYPETKNFSSFVDTLHNDIQFGFIILVDNESRASLEKAKQIIEKMNPNKKGIGKRHSFIVVGVKCEKGKGHVEAEEVKSSIIDKLGSTYCCPYMECTCITGENIVASKDIHLCTYGKWID